jgi:hypothetical protein
MKYRTAVSADETLTALGWFIMRRDSTEHRRTAQDDQRLRKLEALAARPGTPSEGAAARAAIERIRRRLRLPESKSLLIGIRLRLDRDCDRRHPCCDRAGIVGEGRGPHRYSVRCATCKQYRDWISAKAAAVLEALQKAGRLSSSPTLRDTGIVP